MKILICGNLGYVGPTVCKHLSENLQGCELVGLDTGFFSSRLSQFDRIGDTYCHLQYYADIRDVEEKFFQGFDSVVVLSAISNDPMGNTFEKVTGEINYNSVARLIKNFAPLRGKRLVFASSCSMYGSGGAIARRENDELNPLTAYARSKVSVEKILEETKLGEGSTATSLRFATACGMSDRLRLDLVLNDFVASAILNESITLLSDGRAWRPLINVKDMARAIEWAIMRDENVKSSYLAVNIGAKDWNYTIMQLAEAVQKKVPGCKISFDPKAISDKRSYRVNFDLFKELAPNHQPINTLESTIDELICGITKIRHLIGRNFRSSDFMRLNMLDAHLKANRLSNDLRWTS